MYRFPLPTVERRGKLRTGLKRISTEVKGEYPLQKFHVCYCGCQTHKLSTCAHLMQKGDAYVRPMHPFEAAIQFVVISILLVSAKPTSFESIRNHANEHDVLTPITGQFTDEAQHLQIRHHCPIVTIHLQNSVSEIKMYSANLACNHMPLGQPLTILEYTASLTLDFRRSLVLTSGVSLVSLYIISYCSHKHQGTLIRAFTSSQAMQFWSEVNTHIEIGIRQPST